MAAGDFFFLGEGTAGSHCDGSVAARRGEVVGVKGGWGGLASRRDVDRCRRSRYARRAPLLVSTGALDLGAPLRSGAKLV